MQPMATNAILKIATRPPAIAATGTTTTTTPTTTTASSPTPSAAALVRRPVDVSRCAADWPAANPTSWEFGVFHWGRAQWMYHQK